MRVRILRLRTITCPPMHTLPLKPKVTTVACNQRVLILIFYVYVCFRHNQSSSNFVAFWSNSRTNSSHFYGPAAVPYPVKWAGRDGRQPCGSVPVNGACHLGHSHDVCVCVFAHTSSY